MIYWKPHAGSDGVIYRLDHLYPFEMTYILGASGAHPLRCVVLHVRFGLHTFTRRLEPPDDPGDRYSDAHEIRTFCPERHALSRRLPAIVRDLDRRPCGFARSQRGVVNYVTVDTRAGSRYGVFFNLRKLSRLGPDALELAILSAYPFDPGKPDPSLGRIRFRVLVAHAIRGTRPRVPLK